eukprot:Awhi_evm1s10509
MFGFALLGNMALTALVLVSIGVAFIYWTVEDFTTFYNQLKTKKYIDIVDVWKEQAIGAYFIISKKSWKVTAYFFCPMCDWFMPDVGVYGYGNFDMTP